MTSSKTVFWDLGRDFYLYWFLFTLHLFECNENTSTHSMHSYLLSLYCVSLAKLDPDAREMDLHGLLIQ